MLRKRSVLSLESDSETTAIDRVLDKSEASDGKPFSLTSAILAQREKMVKEAEEQAAKDEEENEDEDSDSDDSDDSDSGDSDSGGDSDDWDDDGDGEGGGDDDDWDDPADDDDSDDSDGDDDDSEDDDEDDDEDDSDDEDSDKEEDSDDEDEDKDDKKDKKDDKKMTEQEKAAASWESHQDTFTHQISNEDITPNVDFTKKRKWDIFKSLREAEIGRRKVLMSFGFGFEDGEETPDAKDAEKEVFSNDSEKNIAFTKDAIIQSISNLGQINKKYYDNTELFIEKLTKSIPKLDERLLNFQRVYNKGEVEFTNKMVSDVSVLAHIAYDKDIKLREVLKINKNYSKDSNDIAKMILNTKFEHLEDVFLNKNFMPKGEILEYKKKLPGFNVVMVNLPEYRNYLKTSPLEYQYYTVKENNPNDTYEIRPVSITEEKDVEYFLAVLKSIIIDLSVSVDILRVLLTEFKKFMDTLKILRVGVEEDEFEKLSELGLDEKVQQFILFKLIVEIVSTNINLTIESVSGFMEVMDGALKLVDIEPEVENDDEDDSGSGWDSDDDSDDSDNDDEDEDDSGDDDDDDWDDDDW